MVNDTGRPAHEEVFPRLLHDVFLLNAPVAKAQFQHFVLPISEGPLVCVANLLIRGSLLVQFFSGDWYPYFRSMLAALIEHGQAIEIAGTLPIAMTPNTGPWAYQVKSARDELFGSLSDIDCGVKVAVGMIFWVPPIYHAWLQCARIHLADRHGSDAWTLLMLAMFLLDRDGKIVWRFIDIYYTRRAVPEHFLSPIRTLGGSN